jgi:hypothetical protein
MDFITYGVCFSFAWTDTLVSRAKLQANKLQRVCTICL